MLKKLLKVGKKEKSKNSLADEILQDVQQCIANDHTEDAINIIENTIEKREENQLDSSSITKLYESLIGIHQKQKNGNRMLISTQRDYISFVEREAPELSSNTLPIIYDLFKSGELKLDPNTISSVAEIALIKQEYDEVIKVVGKFANENPEHPDIGKNYLFVGKSLMAKGNPEQAYRLLSSLIKKYPEDSHFAQIEKCLAEAKSALKQKKS